MHNIMVLYKCHNVLDHTFYISRNTRWLIFLCFIVITLDLGPVAINIACISKIRIELLKQDRSEGWVITAGRHSQPSHMLQKNSHVVASRPYHKPKWLLGTENTYLWSCPSPTGSVTGFYGLICSSIKANSTIYSYIYCQCMDST